jgi:hypothetical protein
MWFKKRLKFSSGEVLRQSYKILALALLLFLLSVGLMIRTWWQLSHDNRPAGISLSASGFSPGTMAGDRPVVLTNSPEPKKFQHVDWPLVKDLKISGECHDQFYTILIYPEVRDYRQDPTSSVFNRAFPCTKGEKWQQSLAAFNLQSATSSYYLVRADQGTEGSWYNPY